MARRDPSGRPFRFIRNDSRATAPNVYLMLYPRAQLADQLRQQPALSWGIWQALNNIPMQDLQDVGRVYGGGLHKLEPRELANAPADEIARALGWPPHGRTQQLQLLEPQAGYRA